MAEENTITTIFRANIDQFSASTQDMKRYMGQVNAEFAEATAGLGKWSDSTDGLTAKLKQLDGTLSAQKKQLSALEDEYNSLTDEEKKSTAQGQKLATAIMNQRAKVKTTEGQIDKYSEALDELTDAGVSTRKELDDLNKKMSENGNTASSVAGKIAGGLAKGFLGLATAVVGVGASFIGLAESTRDYRQEMNQLEVALGKVGLSADEAYQAFNYFGSVLGDTRKAKETLLVISQLTSSEQELESWTDTLTGIYATFGEAIPLQAMSEAIVLASKDSKATAGLAEALKWGNVNVDEFNASLASLATEQERTAYIQETLNGIYGESAKAYNELNKDILDASTAQTDLENAMAKLGATAEPIATMLKRESAEILTAISPFVELIGKGLTDAFSGCADGAKEFGEGLSGIVSTALEKVSDVLPKIIDLVTGLVPTLIQTIAESLPSIVQAVVQGFSQILSAIGEMLPTLVPTIVDALILVAETIIDNLDKVIDAGIQIVLGLADGLLEALPRLIDKIPYIIDKVVDAIVENLPKLVTAGIELIVKLAIGIVKAIPQLVSKIPMVIASIVKGLIEGIPQLVKAGADMLGGIFKGFIDPSVIFAKVKEFGESLVNGIKDFFGIHSPSRLFEDEIGKNLALGIGEGFEDEIGAVNKTMQNSLDEITPTLNVDPTAIPNASSTAQASWIDALADRIIAKTQTINNTYNFDYKFEKMETSKLALHKATLEAKRAIGG